MGWERTWVETAKKLPVGSKIRVRCCGLDNSRTISHKKDCYITGCFRCKEDVAERKTALAVLKSAAEVQEFKRKVKDRKLRLTEELDNSAVSWLLMANVKPHLWKKYGIRQCLDSGMVFLPMPLNRKYNGFLLRNVTGRHPKYISDVKSGYATLGDTDPVVITEDYLSAMRVYEDSGVSTLCALGTSTPPDAVLHLVQNHKHVILWLDSDTAGREADAKWRKELEALGIQVDSVVTEEDPKMLSRAEILKVLESVNVGT